MKTRVGVVFAIIAFCLGCSFLLLEVVLVGAGGWSWRFAALQEPVDLFSGSCDVSQLEDMEVVNGTIHELCGRYDYTYDDYITDIAYYYVLPIDTGGSIYYIGIRETRGRKGLFGQMAGRTAYDVTERGVNVKSEPLTPPDENAEPIFVEGFLFEMSEAQYRTFRAWLEKAGLEGQALPYYIEERDIAASRRACIGGLVCSAAGVVMVAGSIAVWIYWRRRGRHQTQITIGNVVYDKSQLARVNGLIEHVELMQAVYELSRITGLELPQAEKIVRKWHHYWY